MTSSMMHLWWRALGRGGDAVDAVVDCGVVSPAEQDHVVEGGGATVSPMDDVVSVAPARRMVAPIPSASPVPAIEGPPYGWCHRSAFPPDIEHVTFRAEHHRDDAGITRKATDGLGSHRGSVDLGEPMASPC
jgi:hypothetical protein